MVRVVSHDTRHGITCAAPGKTPKDAWFAGPSPRALATGRTEQYYETRMSPTLPSKKEVVLALLERSSVFIHLDPRRDQVAVPPWFKKQPRLVLQIGLNMPVPIRDLSVDDECISCTLSFNRSPYFCWIPWQAIFALVGEDQRGMVWPDDVPPELVEQAGAENKRTERKHLRAVTTDDGSPADPERSAPEPALAEPEPIAAGDAEAHALPTPLPRPEETATKSKRPSHLRLVK
jgi:stringent starvation protein B